MYLAQGKRSSKMKVSHQQVFLRKMLGTQCALAGTRFYLILGIRLSFSLVLGTRFSILRTRTP